MKYNFDFDKLRKKGTCINFKNEIEFNIFVDWYTKNINKINIFDRTRYYKNICLIFCSIQSDDKFGHDKYNEYIKKNHPTVYTFDELLINKNKEDDEMKENFKDYKQIKSISGKDVVNNACREEFEKFVKHFGFHNEIEFNKENFNWIRDNIENGIKFGLDYGFIEKVEEYDENKLYFCSSGHDTSYLSKLSKINNKFIWVSINRNPMFSSEYHNSIEKAIEHVESLKWVVNSFDTFEEAMEYYHNKNKIDNMSKTHKINLLYNLSKEFKVEMSCDNINCDLVSCKNCKFYKSYKH